MERVPFHNQQCIKFFCTIRRFFFHFTVSFFITFHQPQSGSYCNRNSFNCNCYIVRKIKLKYTFCAKQNCGCKNNYILKLNFNDNIELKERHYYITSLSSGLSWWIFITLKHYTCAQVFICLVFN